MVVLRKAKQKRLTLAISVALATGVVYANFDPELELSDLDGTNGFVINGSANYDYSGASVSAAGDINGDGISDLVIGAPYATTGADYTGASYVVFGSDQGLPNPLNLSGLNGSDGFVINGSSTYDYAGASVSAAGDINGDGIDDLIIGAPGSSPIEAYSGASYVVFGSDQTWAGSLDLSSLDGSNGFVINGVNEFDESGSSVSTAGDINGDGFDDLIIGAPYAGAGASYVVFGSDQPWASSLNLSGLDGNNGFVINGVSAGDSLGGSVSSAGDINDDGFDDLIIGAIFAGAAGTYTGASYVVFGSDQGLPNPLNLSGLDGSNGFVINGVSDGDEAGTSVSAAGDINGDGIDDLIIGAIFAGATGTYTGASYVVFGSDQTLPNPLNLSGLNGNNGFVINGVSVDDQSGLSVNAAGDINFDGFDDLIIGAPLANSNGINSGASYVVFGSDQGLPNPLNLSGLDGSNGFVINGVTAGDNSGTSVSTAGDINGDGIDDLITGAPLAAPNGDYSGASYVVYGVRGRIEVTKSGPASAKAGDEITYTISFTDTDTGTGALGTCTGNDPLLGGDLGVFTAGVTRDFDYTVQVADPSPLLNTASITCDVVGSDDAARGIGRHSVDLIAPSIEVTKTGPATARVGDEITFTIGFTDTGTGTLGICTGNDLLLGGDLGVFTAGVTRDFTYTVQVDDPDPLPNTATITCDVEGFDNKASDNDSHSVDLNAPTEDLIFADSFE